MSSSCGRTNSRAALAAALVALAVVENHRAEHRLVALDAAVKQVHVAQKVHHELVGRMMKDFVGRAGLLDAAVVHHHDLVGHFEGFFLVVGDEEAGDVDFVVQFAQPAAQPLTHLGVERPNGSSSNSTFGSIASARAKATRCR